MSQTKAQLLDNIKDNVQLDARNALRFADTDSSHYVAFKAPATVSSNVTWTLPAADGSANYVLATDGSGTLSWIADPAGQWTTSGSNIYFTGGNVGIGDNSPSNPLSVTGASAFDGDVTFTGASYSILWDKSADDLIFNDNAKAVFGTSSDGLEIFHNGSHSYIDDTGTGNLYIKSSGIWLRDSGNGGIQNGSGTENHIQWHNDGNVELYYNSSKTLQTTSYGAEVIGTFRCDALSLLDNEKIQLGSSGTDLEIYHNGSNSYIDNNTGSLIIRTNVAADVGGDIFIKPHDNEDGISVIHDGAVELYYDNSKTFETVQYGAKAGGELSLYHQSGNSYIKNDTGNLHIGSNGFIALYGGNDYGETAAKFINDGAVELYHNGTKQCETNSGGMNWADSKRAYFGNSSDLQIYHDGSDSYIVDTNAASDLFINSTKDLTLKIGDGAGGNHTALYADNNGAVRLYYDNVQTFNTTPNGIEVRGTEGVEGHIYLYADEGDDVADWWLLKADHVASGFYIQNKASGSWEDSIRCFGDGAVEIFYDNSKKLHTFTGGVKFFGTLEADDSDKIKLGDNADLQLYHDGNNSYIEDAGTGSLILKTGRVSFNDTSNNEMGRFDGEGLKFNGDTAAANGLDDYEEGTFSPRLDFASSGNASFDETTGQYRKIGRFLYWSALVGTAKGTASGEARIYGLPFTSSSVASTRTFGTFFYQDGFASITGQPWVYQGAAGQNYAPIYMDNGSGGTVALTASNFSSSLATFRIGGWYTTD